MMNPSDEELVERCKVELPRTTRSYELLVQRYMNRVYTNSYNVVGHKEEAEDIAQEVFVKAYHGLKNFEQRSSFSSWLHRITINTSLDALDRMKRQQTVTAQPKHESTQDTQDDLESVKTPASSAADPEKHLLQKELRECINSVLKTLEREQATLIFLRDFQNLSYDEVAHTLGVGLSAIKMRIHRARLAFQDVFNQFCGSIYMPISKSLNYSAKRSTERK